MAMKTNRRTFLKASTVAAAGYWAAGGVQAQESNSPNEKLAFACIGVGGKGSSDSTNAAKHGEIVAVCDVDAGTLDGKAKAFTMMQKGRAPAKYADFREMLEEVGDKIDAVTVSTPDHNHAAATLMAMRMGLGAYTQKPLTRTIYEARLLGDVAKETGVATQMGNQGTANNKLREAAALCQGGHLGKVEEVHVWTNRPVWPQGQPRAAATDPPASLDWDLWLGTAPERPYAPGYHTFKWRGWWDFGSGALGDMACHTVNMPYMGLDLKDPTSVQAETSGHDGDYFPSWSKIVFDFPANEKRGPVKFFWYDGGKRVDPDLIEGIDPSKSGCAVIGEKGTIYSTDDYCGNYQLLGMDMPEGVEYEKSPGHVQEWIDALKGGKAARSAFSEYATGLTETILLGNLAVWAAKDGEGPRVDWDAKNLVASNVDGIDGIEELIKPTYRDGYILDA